MGTWVSFQLLGEPLHGGLATWCIAGAKQMPSFALHKAVKNLPARYAAMNSRVREPGPKCSACVTGDVPVPLANVCPIHLSRQLLQGTWPLLRAAEGLRCWTHPWARGGW